MQIILDSCLLDFTWKCSCETAKNAKWHYKESSPQLYKKNRFSRLEDLFLSKKKAARIVGSHCLYCGVHLCLFRSKIRDICVSCEQASWKKCGICSDQRFCAPRMSAKWNRLLFKTLQENITKNCSTKDAILRTFVLGSAISNLEYSKCLSLNKSQTFQSNDSV